MTPDRRATAKWKPRARRISLAGLEQLLLRAVRQAAAAQTEGAQNYKLTAAEIFRREVDRRVNGR